jgi:hypothetical protein
MKALKTHFLLVFLVVACLWTFSCQAPHRALVKSYRQFSPAEKTLADSLLLSAMDHEALYTLLDTLKPMSSVKMFRLPIFSTQASQRDSALQVMQSLQKLVNALHLPDVEFVLNPFERRDSIYKNMEVYAFRKSRLQSLLREQSSFYAGLGLTQGALPASVLAITEYENKYTRWRSYGYLFGYPAHAVDFFVAAGQQQDSTGQFVKRDFFHLPVYVGRSGYFTYAVPKGYVPQAVDSTIYTKAKATLDRYQPIRQNNANPVRILKKLGR